MVYFIKLFVRAFYGIDHSVEGKRREEQEIEVAEQLFFLLPIELYFYF